jgi:hypothetical protein
VSGDPRGTGTSGVVLELRRKDNGNPIWIQFWSKPAPEGELSLQERLRCRIRYFSAFSIFLRCQRFLFRG